MALHWNVKAIEAREGAAFTWPTDAHGEQRLNGMIECVIWATMFVGIPKITEANAEDFALRLRQWENVAGCISSRSTPITAAEVRQCIGLETNASTKSKAAFKANVAQIAERNAREAIAKEAKATQEAKA